MTCVHCLIRASSLLNHDVSKHRYLSDTLCVDSRSTNPIIPRKSRCWIFSF